MTITTSTRKMTAKEQMIFDLGFKAGVAAHKEKMFYKLECKNCYGRGNTDSLDGAYECNQCGGCGHRVPGLEHIKIEELIT